MGACEMLAEPIEIFESGHYGKRLMPVFNCGIVKGREGEKVF